MVLHSELEILSGVDAGFNLFEESAKPDQRNMTYVLSVKRTCGLARHRRGLRRDKDGKRHERVEWLRVVAIGKLGLSCHQYLKKGRQVFLECRLRNREYEAKIDGRKQHHTEIVATRVQFLGAPPGQVEVGEVEDSVASLESEAAF